MFKIGKLFHLTHVVDDLEAVDRWYDDVFSVTRFYNGYEELAGRNASLIAIGDVIMEPMMPARVENFKNPSVKRFHAARYPARLAYRRSCSGPVRGQAAVLRHSGRDTAPRGAHRGPQAECLCCRW